MITLEKKLAALVSILPVMMDFMEDIKDGAPQLYNRRIKKAGNDFIDEVEKDMVQLYRKIKDDGDEGLMEFYNNVHNMGLAFRQWLAKEDEVGPDDDE